MFSKFSLVLVMMALACAAEENAGESKYLINVKSEVLDGKLALEKLLGEEFLTPEQTANIIAMTDEKRSVKVENFTLSDLHRVNIDHATDCEPELFNRKFLPCNEQVISHPNLKDYCLKCLKK
jgi:hypothetical protein